MGLIFFNGQGRWNEQILEKKIVYQAHTLFKKHPFTHFCWMGVVHEEFSFPSWASLSYICDNKKNYRTRDVAQSQ